MLGSEKQQRKDDLEGMATTGKTGGGEEDEPKVGSLLKLCYILY
jgi:hypothetical protein